MSDYTDFYLSWEGCGAFGNTPNIRPIVPPTPVVVFSPLDLSACYIWFNCDDLNTITTDGEGVVTNVVNQGLAASSAIQATGEVGVVTDVNNLNSLNFPSGTGLQVTLTLPYTRRTQFVVFKSTTDMSGAPYPYLTFMAGGLSSMNTGVNWDSGTTQFQYAMCQNGINCPILGQDPTNPYSIPTIVMFLSDDVDVGNNVLYVNGGGNLNTSTDAGNAFTQTEDTYIINNPGPPGQGQGQVLCEVIEYGRALNSLEISQVLNYLSAKWDIALSPSPPPPISIPVPIAEYDFNNYEDGDPTIPESQGGDPAAINEYALNSFTSDMTNSYLSIYAPDNYPNQTGGVTAPSLSNITAIELWVRYVPPESYYNQYFVDARTGATNAFWLTSNAGVTDTFGSFFADANVYLNTSVQVVDISNGTPSIQDIANNGWFQVFIVPTSTITDDISFFMRYTGEQGMPLDVADIALYDQAITSTDVLNIYNNKCTRYGLSPIPAPIGGGLLGL